MPNTRRAWRRCADWLQRRLEGPSRAQGVLQFLPGRRFETARGSLRAFAIPDCRSGKIGFLPLRGTVAHLARCRAARSLLPRHQCPLSLVRTWRPVAAECRVGVEPNYAIA